ncbi:hypothetical protein Mapa_009672 [Marchantia paleacea]|nr:hypothetical protein Mapa_009672 [Marchantia paleacea]
MKRMALLCPFMQALDVEIFVCNRTKIVSTHLKIFGVSAQSPHPLREVRTHCTACRKTTAFLMPRTTSMNCRRHRAMGTCHKMSRNNKVIILSSWRSSHKKLKTEDHSS